MSNKPLLIDIDDTLAETQVEMLKYINRKGNRQYRFEDLTREHREKGVPEYEKLVQEFLGRPELVRDCKPYANSLAAIRRLHSAGYAIHIASSRREPLHEVTLQWLEDHGFADYVERVHPRPGSSRGHAFKVKVAGKVKPVAAFDDTLEVAEALADSGIPVFLIEKPWNADEPLPRNVIRSADFAEAVDKFLSHA